MASVERLDQPAEVASKVLRRAQVSKVSETWPSYRDGTTRADMDCSGYR